MTIKPKNFATLDAFADALANDAIKGLPVPRMDDDHETAQAKRAAIRDAMEAAEERAWDLWGRWIEDCEEMFDRGVGPAWE